MRFTSAILQTINLAEWKHCHDSKYGSLKYQRRPRPVHNHHFVRGKTGNQMTSKEMIHSACMTTIMPADKPSLHFRLMAFPKTCRNGHVVPIRQMNIYDLLTSNFLERSCMSFATAFMDCGRKWILFQPSRVSRLVRLRARHCPIFVPTASSARAADF